MERPADHLPEAGARGRGTSWITPSLSVVAVVLSVVSFYETVLRGPALKVFVPPVIQYSDPYNGPFEVFNIPVTVANDGARNGTVLSFDLTVRNRTTGETKRFHSFKFGRWTMDEGGVASGQRDFAPLAVAGRAAISEAVLFFPNPGEEVERIVNQEGGTYELELVLNTPPSVGWGESVQPLRFEMVGAALDHRVFTRGTMPFYEPSFRAISSDANAHGE